MFIVSIDQGDYLQLRGGNDWGRANSWNATRFPTREEAQGWADNVKRTTGKAVVEPAEDD